MTLKFFALLCTVCFAFLGFNSSLAASPAAGGNADPSSLPMIFQADKNNLQILPQRFEYSLLDESRIKIGDILIDSATFGFQVASSVAYPGKYRARVVLPHGLVKNGSISIRNNTGKAIWSAPIRQEELKLVKQKNADANPSLRTQLAEFMVDRLEPALIEDMKYLPFMSFCVLKAAEDTRINLCSREMFLAQQNGKTMIRSRSKGKKTAFVEINGRTVSNQGIIFLNDETQNVGFRSTSESGATLEIETRMKRVDFKDVVLSPDQKSLILTASGTEPVNDESIQRLSTLEWRATVDAVRPVLYLKGAGDIPMRQEFYVRGQIPAENQRPVLSRDSRQRTYSPQVELNGTAAPGTTISAGNKISRVEVTGQQFTWWVEDIPAGRTSRHYLNVAQGTDSNFSAAFDIQREFAWEADLGIGFLVPAAQAFGYGGLTWWAEDFMGSSEEWARLHWGLRLSQQLVLNKKTNESNVTITDLELIWRANAGFHYADPTWGLYIPVALLQVPGLSTQTLGVGGFYSTPPSPWLKQWFQWQETRLSYLMPTTSGTIKMSSAIRLESVVYRHMDTRWSLHSGLGAMMYSFSPGSSKTDLAVKAGATYRF